MTFFFNPDWSTYVCGADEIRDYQKSIVNNFGLQGHISFNTGVKKATWDEISSKWTIETDTNETFQVTHLISGCGVLRTPNIPNFKGPENSIHFFEYVLKSWTIFSSIVYKEWKEHNVLSILYSSFTFQFYTTVSLICLWNII